MFGMNIQYLHTKNINISEQRLKGRSPLACTSYVSQLLSVEQIQPPLLCESSAVTAKIAKGMYSQGSLPFRTARVKEKQCLRNNIWRKLWNNSKTFTVYISESKSYHTKLKRMPLVHNDASIRAWDAETFRNKLKLTFLRNSSATIRALALTDSFISLISLSISSMKWMTKSTSLCLYICSVWKLVMRKLMS